VTGEQSTSAVDPRRRAEGVADTLALRARLGEVGPAVRRYLFGMCHDWDEAEDIAQEAMLKAWRKLDSFDGRAELATWVFTIARNHWRDRLRRKRRRPETQSMTGEYVAARTEPPGAAAQRDELAGIVRRAVAGLPDEQREALALRESEGLTFVQIGEMLGVPTGIVKSRVRYALGKLADELKSYKRELDR